MLILEQESIPMASSLWFRQFQVLVITHRRLLMRHPIHLCILLFSSTLFVIFAWLAGQDARGPNGAFPPLTDCGMVDPYYVANSLDSAEYGWSSGEIPVSLNEPWRRGLPVECYIALVYHLPFAVSCNNAKVLSFSTQNWFCTNLTRFYSFFVFRRCGSWVLVPPLREAYPHF